MAASRPDLPRGTLNDPEWLIKFDDGTYTGWHYNPEELQPPGRLSLLSRATGAIDKITNKELDRLDAEEVRKVPGLLGEFLGCGALIVLAFLGLLVLFRIF